MKNNRDARSETSPDMDRRLFLKKTAMCGMAAMLPTFGSRVYADLNKTESAEEPHGKRENTFPVITQKRTLGSGRFALEVSALGFGVMGMNYHRGVSPDKKKMLRLLHQCVDHGVTLFDTAEIYGPFTNELLAGEGLYPYRDRIHVTTKFGFLFEDSKPLPGRTDSRPATIRKVAEESLKRLRVDSLDLFYQHRFDPDVPIEEVAGAVKELIQEGKVKRFGLCEVGAVIIRKAHAVQPITAVQSEYHLMWREPEKEILPVCEELGIGFVPYSPLNRGFLSAALNEYTKFEARNDNRAILPRFTPEAIRANTRIVETLNEFGRPRGATASQIALAWLLGKSSSIVPIPGTTKLSHLEENLRSADLEISQSEFKELEDSIEKISIVGDRYPASQQSLIQR